MICTSCTYTTERLEVREWHSRSSEDHDLADVVGRMLTPRVTQTLPPTWQGTYSRERVQTWIAERDSEGTTLLVVDSSNNEVIGLTFLFETKASASPDAVELRLGYLLSEAHWGEGFASEMIAGFVNWCRQTPSIASVTAGVNADNPASARVLEKNGFRLATANDAPAGEQMFHLRLRA